MDRQLRSEIVAEVKRGIQESLEVAEERWITADELCQQFQMFSPSWVKTYGYKLPRQRAEVLTDKGTVATRFAYPQHRIARMIAEGEIKNFISNPSQ